MYRPEAFREDDPARLHALMRVASFAVLISVDDGVPVVSHLPLLLDAERGALGTLTGHVARANPHWRLFDGRETLAVFRGPHGYVSPAWYATRPAPPTWNYAAVHAAGVPRLLDDEAEVRTLLTRMVVAYDPAPARLELPAEFIGRMLRGIVAFELPIGRLDGKLKLGQNRSPADRAGTIAGLRAAGDAASTALAELMGCWTPASQDR